MEIFKVLIPLFYGLFPIFIAAKTYFPAKKKLKGYISKQSAYRFAKGRVLSIERKESSTGKKKSQKIYTIEYEFTAEDGNTYRDAIKYSCKDDIAVETVSLYYDPSHPDEHFAELEAAGCERQIKDSYTIFYCGLLTTLFLLVFLHIAI